jgi:hypothetical protein
MSEVLKFPRYAFCLSKSCPPEVLAVLEGYLVPLNGTNFLFCSHYEFVYSFVKLKVYPNPDDLPDRKPREVLLPTHFVLLIDIAHDEDDVRTLGFAVK